MCQCIAAGTSDTAVGGSKQFAQDGELGLLDVHLVGDANSPEASTSMALTDLAYCRFASHVHAFTKPD